MIFSGKVEQYNMNDSQRIPNTSYIVQPISVDKPHTQQSQEKVWRFMHGDSFEQSSKNSLWTASLDSMQRLTTAMLNERALQCILMTINNRL